MLHLLFMDRPEVIEERIADLQKQLEQSKKEYQYELICNSDWSDDMIGFFNIGNTRKILAHLYNGRELQYRHEYFGTVDVYMNPQRNRISVSENGNIKESNIMSHIIWGGGDWYLNTNKK